MCSVNLQGKPAKTEASFWFTCQLWPPCCATPPPSSSSSYAPTSNTASHDTHEKISSWVPFSFLIWVWGSAWRPSAAGAPLLKYPENEAVLETIVSVIRKQTNRVYLGVRICEVFLCFIAIYVFFVLRYW